MQGKFITVTGKGRVHIVPDITRLELSLVSIHDTYDDAYDQAKFNTDKLNFIMYECKLDKKLPKTTRLDINKKTQNEYDKYHNYKGEKFIGYCLNHDVKIDLGMDMVSVNKVIKQIGINLKHAEIKVVHTVKDSRPIELKMLERAVKDSKEKAEIMAKACGCKLGDVVKIDYGVQEISIYSQARVIHDASEAAACSQESLDITPDDFGASDTVTVVWSLQ